LPLRSNTFPGGVGDAVPVSGLLLFHLPQDGGWRRLIASTSGQTRTPWRSKEYLSIYHAKLYDRGGPGEVPISKVERNVCKFRGGPTSSILSPRRWTPLCRSRRSGYTPRLSSPPPGASSPRARTSGASPCGQKSPSQSGTVATGSSAPRTARSGSSPGLLRAPDTILAV
jgi:hypothetical protein